MSKKRFLRARAVLLLSLCAALGGIGATAATAQAAQFEYLNELMPPHTWSGNRSGAENMLSNTVYYTGSGTVNVCEKVWRSGAILVSYKCGNQVAEATPAELEPYKTILFPEGENNSGFNHTIKGVWVER